MSKHFTKKAAQRAANEANAKQRTAGRSSGHSRIDWVVRPSGKKVRRHSVVPRSR